MRVTIQFESHRVELAAVYELEHDDDVLEYCGLPAVSRSNPRYAGHQGRPVAPR